MYYSSGRSKFSRVLRVSLLAHSEKLSVGSVSAPAASAGLRKACVGCHVARRRLLSVHRPGIRARRIRSTLSEPVHTGQYWSILVRTGPSWREPRAGRASPIAVPELARGPSPCAGRIGPARLPVFAPPPLRRLALPTLTCLEASGRARGDSQTRPGPRSIAERFPRAPPTRRGLPLAPPPASRPPPACARQVGAAP